MSLEYDRDHCILAIECDCCEASDEFEGDDFNEAFDEAKAEGWRAFKDGDDWMHKCPDCVGLDLDGDDDEV